MHFANHPLSKAPCNKYRDPLPAISRAGFGRHDLVHARRPPPSNVASAGGHRSQVPARAVAFFWLLHCGRPPAARSSCSLGKPTVPLAPAGTLTSRTKRPSPLGRRKGQGVLQNNPCKRSIDQFSITIILSEPEQRDLYCGSCVNHVIALPLRNL